MFNFILSKTVHSDTFNQWHPSYKITSNEKIY